MLIGLHDLAAKHSNLLTGYRVGRETGGTGVEIGHGRLKRHPVQGIGTDSSGLPLQDI
jgi:hypothetical protein